MVMIVINLNKAYSSTSRGQHQTLVPGFTNVKINNCFLFKNRSYGSSLQLMNENSEKFPSNHGKLCTL